MHTEDQSGRATVRNRFDGWLPALATISVLVCSLAAVPSAHAAETITLAEQRHFRERLLAFRNETPHRVRLWAIYRAPDADGELAWKPAGLDAPEKATLLEIGPGQEAMVEHDHRPVAIERARFWAESETGWTWREFAEKDLWLIEPDAEGRRQYQAEAAETFTYTLKPTDRPLPVCERMIMARNATAAPLVVHGSTLCVGGDGREAWRDAASTVIQPGQTAMLKQADGWLLHGSQVKIWAEDETSQELRWWTHKERPVAQVDSKGYLALTVGEALYIFGASEKVEISPEEKVNGPVFHLAPQRVAATKLASRFSALAMANGDLTRAENPVEETAKFLAKAHDSIALTLERLGRLREQMDDVRNKLKEAQISQEAKDKIRSYLDKAQPFVDKAASHLESWKGATGLVKDGLDLYGQAKDMIALAQSFDPKAEPGQNLKALSQLLENYGGEVPLIGPFLEAYGKVTGAMVDALDRLAHNLDERVRQGHVGAGTSPLSPHHNKVLFKQDKAVFEMYTYAPCGPNYAYRTVEAAHAWDLVLLWDEAADYWWIIRHRVEVEQVYYDNVLIGKELTAPQLARLLRQDIYLKRQAYRKQAEQTVFPWLKRNYLTISNCGAEIYLGGVELFRARYAYEDGFQDTVKKWLKQTFDCLCQKGKPEEAAKVRKEALSWGCEDAANWKCASGPWIANTFMYDVGWNLGAGSLSATYDLQMIIQSNGQIDFRAKLAKVVAQLNHPATGQPMTRLLNLDVVFRVKRWEKDAFSTTVHFTEEFTGSFENKDIQWKTYPIKLTIENKCNFWHSEHPGLADVALGAGKPVQVSWKAETREVRVPDVVGQLGLKAKTILSAAKLAMKSKEEISNEPVLTQDPAAGSLVEPGSAVWVTFHGPAVKMPNVVGMRESEARQKLAGIGPISRVGNPEFGPVEKQSPAAGSQLKPPVSITLYFPTIAAGIVPDVVGKNFHDAKAAIESNRLLMEAHKEGGPAVKQDPVPGTRLPINAKVQVWFSYEALVKVPDVTGMTAAQAKAALETVGLKMHGAGSGVARRQVPMAGLLRPKGDTVVVSFEDAQLVEVPAVVGMPYSQAKTAIESRGLVFRPMRDSALARVATQSPPPGTKAPRGTPVTVTFAVGPQPDKTVVVPNLKGMALSSAKAAAESAGLKLNPQGHSDKPKARVERQEPAAGNRVPSGSTVTVYMSVSGPYKSSTPAPPGANGGGL